MIHFTAAGDTNDLNYLAIQRREDDSDIRIPVYRKESEWCISTDAGLFFLHARNSCITSMYSLISK